MRIAEVLVVVGQQLTELRKLKYPEDTAEDFASRIGCSRTTLYRIEKGLPGAKFETLLNAAEVLGVLDQFSGLFSAAEARRDLATDRVLNSLLEQFGTDDSGVA